MTDWSSESRQRLWIVPGPLVIWAVHFMLAYITAALWCGRFAGLSGSIEAVRLAVGGYTLAALAGILAIGWIGYRAQAASGVSQPYDADSPQDRHRFIGLAALLVAGLSAVAVLYSAMAVYFVETCA